MKITDIIRCIIKPKEFLLTILYYPGFQKIVQIIPDKTYLKLVYWLRMGHHLNLSAPDTFNEKLQWLKLYNRKNSYTTMVDKYLVKQYVADIIGEEYIIPTLGVWDNFDDINFEELPEQFVLKCTHDSGGLVICSDRKNFDKEAAKKKIEQSLKTNYYSFGREWPYKNVKKRIIAEKYMIDSQTNELRDYKFFCFGGQVKCYKIDFDRTIEHHANYFDKNGNLLKFGEVVCPPVFGKLLDQPSNLKKIQELAEKLSSDIPFLRADFYDVDGKVYFGELTFYPASGFGKFVPEEYDLELGKWLALPNGGGTNSL